jgi:hypothetical protein
VEWGGDFKTQFMSQNRKSQSAGTRIGAMLLVMLIILLIGGGGVGYVWQKNEIREMSQKKRQKENRLEDLRRENKMHRDRLDYLRLPWVLDVRARELNLGLAPCPPEQVVRLSEPVAVSTAPTNAKAGLLARRSTPGT